MRLALCEKALLSGFYAPKTACASSLWLLRCFSSKFGISDTFRRWFAGEGKCTSKKLTGQIGLGVWRGSGSVAARGGGKAEQDRGLR
jgi:hypothetical protein